MACEGYRATEGQEVARADADEEVLHGRSGRCCEKEQASEGEERSDCGGPARRRGVGGTKGRNYGEEWDKHDNEACDEGRFSRRREGETSGLELIAGCEEEANDQAGEQSVTVDVAELAAVHDGKSKESQRHAEKIKEEWGGVLERVLDEDEGGAPDEDDSE
jgi:hypothetical protein